MMTCIESCSRESRKEKDLRITRMLEEMVVEEALAAMDQDRSPKAYTLTEISSFVGVDAMTIQRIEKSALLKFKNLMLGCKKDGY